MKNAQSKLFTKFTLVTIFALLLSSCSFQISKKGELELKGLRSTVHVYNDEYGIPHIEALNDEDMMMALGFITASDRLFQMDLIRRIGSGTLSEIFGEKLLKTDILLRKLLLKRSATENWAKFKKSAPQHMIDITNAYIKGVNAYIETQPLPLEMKILRYKPKPFTFEDSLAAAAYLALSFAEGFFVDPLYTDLLDELPRHEVDLMFPRGDLDEKLPLIGQNYSPDEGYYTALNSVVSLLKKDFFMLQGSNSWVVAPSRSKSGAALLASDPHIAFSNPSVWYEAHIKSPTYENYGHYIPLIPFPGLGHNKNRAWAITMSNSDDVDFYKETFHPKNKNLVRYKNKYVPVKKYKEEIFIKGQEKPHKLEVIVTPHGPLIDDTKFVKKGKALSIKWQQLSPKNNNALSFYLLSQSKSVKDLAPALSHAAAPGFNVSMADSKGEIAWHVMGAIPVLNRQTNGREVLNGANGEDEYKRILSIEENPSLYNPENGIIASANYKHQTKGPIPWIGLWQTKDRYLRIKHLLSKKEKWDLEDFKKIQTEQKVIFYRHFKERVLTALTPKTELEKQAYKALNAWEGESNRKSVGTSLYYAFNLILLKNLIYDELGEERFKAYTQGGDTYAFLHHILNRKDSQLWDNVLTKDKKENAQEILNQSFSETVSFLNEKLGAYYKLWKWGDLNTLEFKHLLGKKWPLNHLFNLGPYSVGGGPEQINNFGVNRGNLDFDVYYGVSTRRLIDMSATEESYGVLPTGNSGNRFSKHYSDQVELYLNNKYRKQHMNFKHIDKWKHLKLKPATF